MIYFPLSAALAALAPPLRPHRLARRRSSPPLVALLVVSPNLAWNAANQFATLHHTADNADWHGPRLDLAGLAELPRRPVRRLRPGLLRRLPRRPPPRSRDPARRYLALMSLPILAIVSVQALVSGANANWAAAAHLAALVLATAVLAPRPRLLAARPRHQPRRHRRAAGRRRLRRPLARRRATSSSHRYVGQSALSRHAAEVARDERPRHPGQRQPRHARRLLLHPARLRPRHLRRAGRGLPARTTTPRSTRCRPARATSSTSPAPPPAPPAAPPAPRRARSPAGSPPQGFVTRDDPRLPRPARAAGSPD